MVSIENYLGEDEEISVEPYEGEYDSGTLIVTEVLIKMDDFEYIVSLEEGVDWEEGPKHAISQLAYNELKSRKTANDLVESEGGSKRSVKEDTKIFNSLLVIGYLQPVLTDTVGEVLDHENPSSMVGNATFRGFVQAVADNGNNHYYSLTPEGWKQIIAVHGVEGWKEAAEDMIGDFFQDTEEEKKQETGLNAFQGET